MRVSKIFGMAAAAATTMATAGAAVAQDGLASIGKPTPGGIAFQEPVTEVARGLQGIDTMLLWIITLICIFVVGLLAYVIIRFNKDSNPVPATFTHNTKIEIAWTLIPILILIVIGSFSLPQLFKQLDVPESDLTIKVTGNQWNWSYEYPDQGYAFDAFMLAKDELEEYGYAQDEFLLATDTAVVVPVNAVVKMQVTASDVIHAWKIPAFGVHIDAVPGRLNETWFKAEKEGVYFGQCSELCGKDHSYMPIVVKVVSEDAWAEWQTFANDEYAQADAVAAPFVVASR